MSLLQNLCREENSFSFLGSGLSFLVGSLSASLCYLQMADGLRTPSAGEVEINSGESIVELETPE
jgi:hypothetical protein